jgi:hypothetical protein
MDDQVVGGSAGIAQHPVTHAECDALGGELQGSQQVADLAMASNDDRDPSHSRNGEKQKVRIEVKRMGDGNALRSEKSVQSHARPKRLHGKEAATQIKLDQLCHLLPDRPAALQTTEKYLEQIGVQGASQGRELSFATAGLQVIGH